MSNDGRFLYAVSLASHTITEFAINGDGSITQIGAISDLAMDSSNGLVAREVSAVHFAVPGRLPASAATATAAASTEAATSAEAGAT